MTICSVANRCVCVRAKGFYFIAKSSPLPVTEGEAHLTYGVMINVIKGETPFPYALSSKEFTLLCTGLFTVMYLGESTGVGPVPFGCYCNIEDNDADLLGTAAIWPGPVSIEDA